MSNARKLGNMTTHGLDGDFNVDPTDNTLVVDSTNNRVGIGSATPTTTLDITGTATATAFSGPLTGNVTGTTSSISNHNTDALSEGSTNLYFTNARADARAQLKIDALVDSAPNTLDTLNELAAALGDDANFSTTITNSIATKLPLAGGTMTGNVSFGNNDKAVFGGLLEIYGDGTHARIREYGSGQMKIQGDNMQLLTSAGTSTYLEGNASTGAVTLYHLANAPRISTTATGVDVNGGISTGGVSAPTSSDTGNVYVPSGSTLGFQSHSGNIAWNGVFNSGWKYIASNVASMVNGSNSGLSFYTAASGTAGNALTWDEKFTIHLDGYSTTRGRGFTVDNSDATWHAINIAESIDNRIAFRITPTRQGQTKGISMGAIGQNTTDTGLQAYDTSDNSANAFLINPWGGNVGIGTSSAGQKFQVYIDNSNDLEYGYRNGLTIDRLSDENMDDASASVPADRYWPQGNLKLLDGNVFNSDSNGPGLSFYKHRDNSGNEYVQAFIGTRGVFGSNNTDLRFYVNSANAANLLPTSPQMLISGANGNVGINHDAPRSKLHVSSNNSGVVTSNGAGIEGIQVTRNTGTHGENMYMYTSSDVGWSGNQYIGRLESYGNNTLEIGTQQNLTKAISFGANNTERMVIQGDGNVGINKSVPGSTLDIANNDVSQTTLNVSPPGSGDANVVYISRGSGSHKGSGLKIAGNNYTNGSASNAAFLELAAGSYSGSSTRYIHAHDNSGTDFVVQGDGKVGIGTSSPDAKLHVNGAAIIGSNTNQATTPIAGLHVIDNVYSHWSSTLSKQQVALRVETYWNASAGQRDVGKYGGGIGFNHLGGHSGQHDENVHAWVGLRVEDTPGHERSNLVFATNNITTDEDAGILERMCITPAGDVGIGTKEPVARLDVTSNDASALALAIRGRSTDNISEIQFYDNAGSSRYARIGARPTDTDGLQMFGWGRDINMYTAASTGGSAEKRFTIKKDGAIVHHGDSYGQWVDTMMTPSGVVRNVQFISDRTGTWIVVAKFNPSDLNATQTSYDQISVGFNNTDSAQWSSAFGDYMPSEVRLVSSDNWANDWRGYRQIDWIYGVPNNRPWKQFMLNGNTSGMSHSGDIFGNGNRWGFAVAGAYDGFGEWHNPLMNFMRMSDGNPSIAQTFFTTPSTMNLHGANDAKFSVSKLRTAAGQDGYCNGSIGYDDNTFCIFQSSSSETFNHQSSNKSDAIVYMCLKLADHYKEN